MRSCTFSHTGDMTQILLGTTPRSFQGSAARPVIQNLGPGNVYLDETDSVSASTGIRIPEGETYSWPISLGSRGLWIVSDTDGTDVRFLGARVTDLPDTEQPVAT